MSSIPTTTHRGWKPTRDAQSSLARQFNSVALPLLIASALLIGWSVAQQIERAVVQRMAAATSAYVEHTLQREIQHLNETGELTPTDLAAISRAVNTSPIAGEIVSMRLYRNGGNVVFGSGAGKTFEVDRDLTRAWRGDVIAHISELDKHEHENERQYWKRLLEVYVPVRKQGSDEVIAVAEMYLHVQALEDGVRTAKQRSWAVVVGVLLLAYVTMVGVVKRGSDTIVTQRQLLQAQLHRLERLLRQNTELRERVQRAAASASAVNEHVLSRIAGDLHDGPAQEVSFALLQLSNFERHAATADAALREGLERDLQRLEATLKASLSELRGIATGLSLPDLDRLSLEETLQRAVREHQRRTGAPVELTLESLPGFVPLAIKITAYRVVQEALTNAFRHAGGLNQRVRAVGDGAHLKLEVRNDGRSFTWTGGSEEGHLGLVGMRGRVESLGGVFRVDATVGGTMVSSRLPLDIAPNRSEAEHDW